MTNSIIDKAEQAEGLLGSSQICRAETARVKNLRCKLENQKITVSVIGQFKRGKSTLVNAILGEKLLPVGIVPVTSVVTTIEYGKRYAAVHFDNGIVKSVGFDQLHEYINEQENPGNKLCVSSVTLKTEAPFLGEGLTFVDTPGVGSAHKHNSDSAYAFVKESDGVIFMLSVDSPINEIEIDFLRNAKEYAAKFYFAVNKIDNVDSHELSEYTEYCRRLLCSLMEVEHVAMFAVSAKYGDGLEELKSIIQKDCKTATREILEDSATKKLRHIVKSARVKLDLYWNALKMPAGKLDTGFEQMQKTLKEIEEKGKLISQGLIKADDRDRHFDICGTLDLELNEMKRKLSSSISELFGMDYQYEMTEQDLGDVYNRDSPCESIDEIRERFSGQVRELCDELNETFNLVLLYREKNTITVARRIDDLNKLNRRLRSLLEDL